MNNKRVNSGILLMLLQSLGQSASSLCFVASKFETPQFCFLLGLTGALFGFVIILTLRSFKLSALIATKQFILSAIGSLILGGLCQTAFYESLKYLLPSETTVILGFAATVFAMLVDLTQFRRRPSVLSTLSVFIGTSGTLLICKPNSIIRNNVSNFQKGMGVSLSITCGISAATCLAITTKCSKVSPVWNFIWYEVGSLTYGLTYYSPLDAQLQNCYFNLKLLALAAVLFQTGATVCSFCGTVRITLTSSFVIQLLGVVFSFVVQIFIFPDRFGLASSFGTLLIVVAVSFQVYHLRYTEARSKVEKIVSLSRLENTL